MSSTIPSVDDRPAKQCPPPRGTMRSPMALAYLLVPLPLGLAWCRARLEWEAYAEGLAVARELFGEAHVRDPGLRAHVVGQFVGPAYGWMWPFRRTVERWYDQVLQAPRRAASSS